MCGQMGEDLVYLKGNSESRRGGNPERLSERQPETTWRRLMSHSSIPCDLNLSLCHAAPMIGGRRWARH
jgi:hypothetical protein